MGFEDKAEQSIGLPYRQTNGGSKRAHLIHRPVRDIVHGSVKPDFSPVACDPALLSCSCALGLGERDCL
jgi:hypothetical protein